MFKKLLIALLLPFAWNVNAANNTTCIDTVTKIHIHSNGFIYFNTDKVCQKWCQLDWQSEKQIDRAFSAMVVSQTSGAEIAFVWNDVDVPNCSTPTAVSFVSPQWINL